MQELIKIVIRNGQYIPIELQLEMLEKEKNQIIKAHNEGIWHKEKCFDEGEEYYNQTYNQNK